MIDTRILPTEIWLAILLKLDVASVLVACQINAHVRSVASTEIIWDPIFKANSLVLENGSTYPQSYQNFLKKFKKFSPVYGRVKRWHLAMLEMNSRPLNSTCFNFNGELSLSSLFKKAVAIFGDSKWNDSYSSFLLLLHFVNGELPGRHNSVFGLLGGFQCYGQYSIYPLTRSKFAINGMLSKNIASDRDSESTFRIISSPSALHGSIGDVVLEYKQQNYGSSFTNYGTFLDYFEERINNLYLNKFPRYHPWDGVPNLTLIPVHPVSGPYYNRELTTIQGVATVLVETSTTPGLNNLLQNDIQHCYAITITLINLDPKWSSIQLTTRTWEIYYGDAVENVHGDGIIGEYPIFRNESDVHYYTSCCGGDIINQPTSMCGKFEFVPGSIDHPLGNEFDVTVPVMNFRVFYP